MMARFEVIVERPQGEAPDLNAEIDRFKTECSKIDGVNSVKVLVAIGDHIPKLWSLEDV